MPASSRSRRARGSGWLGMGRGRRKEKPLTLDLFHILLNVKLCSPLSTHCTAGTITASEQKWVLSTQQGLRAAIASTTKGSAPKSPSSVPLKKGESLSQSPADISCLGLRHETWWGWRNKWNLTNCPRVPAHFLPLVPRVSWGLTRRGGRRDI